MKPGDIRIRINGVTVAQAPIPYLVGGIACRFPEGARVDVAVAGDAGIAVAVYVEPPRPPEDAP